MPYKDAKKKRARERWRYRQLKNNPTWREKRRKWKRQWDKLRYTDPAFRRKLLRRRHNYYVANRTAILARTRIWSEKRLGELRRIVAKAKSIPCNDCGGTFPKYVLHFDHKKPSQKIANISYLVRNWHCSPEYLLREMEKCDLVCANCHAKRTHRRGYTWKARSSKVSTPRNRSLSSKRSGTSMRS